jgi:hypothetical protein
MKPDESWKEEWKDMPEFHQEDLSSFRRINVHFRNQEDVDKFITLMGQKISPKQKACWFPEMPIRSYKNKRYVDEPATEPVK